MCEEECQNTPLRTLTHQTPSMRSGEPAENPPPESVRVDDVSVTRLALKRGQNKEHTQRDQRQPHEHHAFVDRINKCQCDNGNAHEGAGSLTRQLR